MSVLIYKNRKMEMCDPLMLNYQLDDGWSLTDKPAKKEKPAQSNNESDEDARLLGKKLKIRNWHNLKISSLKAKIKEAE